MGRCAFKPFSGSEAAWTNDPSKSFVTWVLKPCCGELSVGDIGLGGRGMKIVLALLQQSRVQALNAIYRKRVLSGTELLFRPKY